MAYAVLRYTYSDEPLEEVADAVQELINQHFANHQRMLRAIEADAARRGRVADDAAPNGPTAE